MSASKPHSELAREVLTWLVDNEEGQFNITCQRCGAPFAHEGQPVAAPAEWFGGLDWERQLAEAVISLEEQFEVLRAGLLNIQSAAEHRQTDGVNDRNWISAAWVEDRCRSTLHAVSSPASRPS